ncbi:MAG: metallophosphoesterase [Ruminococcus sp.]|uniref:metallophosphoesterase n=1 Tax=Ruminococcus sp. TaxID=41978 RepID=UPI0025F15BA7|nr:metallophosphoesterase [Ruminococcus sp.]MCR4796125.1 metallophosphoesterase [Ruminococcus sp.]
MGKKLSPKAKKRLRFWLIILAVLIALTAWGFMMKTVRYKVKTDKLDKGLRIVFISDLHNCFYGGPDQSGIIDAVHDAAPDLVVFGGDVIDMWGGTKHALTLIKALSSEYPCCYSPGNHEEMRSDVEDFYNKVRQMCPVLIGEDHADMTINGQDIRLFGAINANVCYKYSTQLQECFDSLDEEHYNILVAHQPEDIDFYLGNSVDTHDMDFDLILSGHAHGGQWRIPKLLDQGLYAPQQGLFPLYTTGMYKYGKTVHIISTGLARPLRMIFIPRIFNRPELSVIDINR